VKRVSIRAFILIAVFGAACGKTESPAAPSSSSATITGSIVMSGGSAAAGPAAFTSAASTVPAGLLVSVAGTSISALVDVAGKFTLLNVPPGNPELRFVGPGHAASLGLTGVEGGQTVTLDVSLTSTTATVNSDRRSLGSEEQLEGRVESLPPTTPIGTFVVAGRTVTTDSSTLYYLHGQPAVFADLVLGQRVHVKGQGSTSSLLARLVNIQNTNTDVGLNLNGVISGFSGTPADFQFTVNGTLVKGDSQTVFFGNTQFLELVDGATVVVKGSQRSGFVYATRIHVEAVDTSVTGVITSKSGTAPDLTLVVAGKTVLTSSVTEVRRKSDVQSVSVLYVNQTVTVDGRLLANGTIVANKIHIEADAAGGYFEMTGNIGAMSGSCPTKTFQIAGYVIKTDAVTTFLPSGSCSSLSNGTQVQVKGVVQADLSVKADSVQK
jgi:hypothetical protein